MSAALEKPGVEVTGHPRMMSKPCRASRAPTIGLMNAAWRCTAPSSLICVLTRNAWLPARRPTSRAGCGPRVRARGRSCASGRRFWKVRRRMRSRGCSLRAVSARSGCGNPAHSPACFHRPSATPFSANMNRSSLEHVIRAASAIADDPEIIVIGSQAILGSFPDAPESLLKSMEADVFRATSPPQPSSSTGQSANNRCFTKPLATTRTVSVRKRPRCRRVGKNGSCLCATKTRAARRAGVWNRTISR